jgi:hypothetical protein
VSLLYQLTRRLLSFPVVLLRRDVAKDAELLMLRNQNTALRRQITCETLLPNSAMRRGTS